MLKNIMQKNITGRYCYYCGSEWYISVLCLKKETDMNFSTYLSTVRMEHAKIIDRYERYNSRY